MKCLVTGGAGFIGSNLVEGLSRNGHEVTVLDNLSSGFMSNIESVSAARFVEGDVRDARIVAEAIRGVDVVFHLAASVGNKRSIDNPIEDAEVNVLGTLRVLEAGRDIGVKKIVISSSAGIFGELKSLPISEDHPIDPDTPYGCTKLCEEKLGLAYAKLYGIEVACLRYFNVFGRNQRFDAYGNVIPIFVNQMLAEEPLTVHGDGEQTRDFVHVLDVVRANIGAASPGVTGVFNIGSGRRISINNLISLLREVSGVNVDVRFGSRRPGDVRDSLADISAAKRAFHFDPNSDLREPLRDYFLWAKQHRAKDEGHRSVNRSHALRKISE